jgi:signal transduction histidine kinase
MTLTLLVVIVVGSVTYQIFSHYLQQRELGGLKTTAQALASQAYPNLWPMIKTRELSRLVATAAFLGDVRVRIFDKYDRLIVDSGLPDISDDIMVVMPFWNVDGMNLDPPIFLFQHMDERILGEFQFPTLDEIPQGASVTIIHRSGDPWSGGYWFEEWVPSSEGKGVFVEKVAKAARSNTSLTYDIGSTDSPQGYVEVSALSDFGSEVLGQVKQALFFGGGGAVVLAGLVGLWISHRLSSPLKRLAETAEKMGDGDLSVRAEVNSGGGEISDLSRQFNQMADHLQVSFQALQNERDALKRFISDASHELRTPITALKNFITLLQESVGNNDAIRDEFLQESQHQIERLEWVTMNLLDLSRLDSGLVTLELNDHDLCEIVQVVMKSFEQQAEDVGVSLETELPAKEVILSCDRTQMEIALSNLLDNALKFTPPEGCVRVGICCDEGIHLWVRDTGTGIRSEDLPHIFDRFFRGEIPLESGDVGMRKGGKTGSGLGLAIVKSITEAHGGHVSVESNPGQGTCIQMVWTFV